LGFNGGGGGALPAHEHTNIANDGGPLDFVNTTIASLSAGSTTYSNGAALQELLIGNPAETLVVNALGTGPEWASGGGVGAWELLGSDTAGAAVGNLSVSGMTVKDILMIILRFENVTNPSNVRVRVNGISTSTYQSRFTANTSLQTYSGTDGFQISNDETNHVFGGTLWIIQPDANLQSTGTEGWFLGHTFGQAASTISQVENGSFYQAQTADITQIDALWSPGNCVGELTVFGANKT